MERKEITALENYLTSLNLLEMELSHTILVLVDGMERDEMFLLQEKIADKINAIEGALLQIDYQLQFNLTKNGSVATITKRS